MIDIAVPDRLVRTVGDKNVVERYDAVTLELWREICGQLA
jgi:hypothetical protein